MKWIAFLALSMVATAQASYTVCPEHVFQVPTYKRAWTVLKNMKPRFTLGECQIEVHVCSSSETQTSDNDVIGDMWIRNQSGVEQYFTFYFPKESQGQVDAGKTWFRYRYKDFRFDAVNGNKEKVSLKIDLWDDGSTIAKILLSTYSSNEHDRFLGIVPMPIQTACFR